MKKIVLLMALVLGLWANEASKVAAELGYINSYSEGIAKAKKEQKLMMLVLVKDGCGWCKRFENETLKDPSIKTQLSGFVKVLVDKYEPMPESMQSNLFPTTRFVDPKAEKSVRNLMGFKEAVDFKEDISAAKAEYKGKK